MMMQQHRAQQIAVTNAMASQSQARSAGAQEFVQRWALNDEATSFLDSLSAPVQTEVLSSFN